LSPWEIHLAAGIRRRILYRVAAAFLKQSFAAQYALGIDRTFAVLMNHLQSLLTFLDRLEAAKVWYRLSKIRDAILVEVAVPGQLWEIEFFADGRIEREVFESLNDVEDIPTADALNDLLRPWVELNQHRDPDA
jgi:hypothetical protein